MDLSKQVQSPFIAGQIVEVLLHLPVAQNRVELGLSSLLSPPIGSATLRPKKP